MMRRMSSDAPQNSSSLIREAFFPTLIYYQDLSEAERLKSKLLRDIYAWRDADEQGVVRSNVAAVGSWHSAVDMHRRPEFEQLVGLIEQGVAQVYSDLDYDPDYPPACDNMWANINPRYGYNRNHMHPNVLWSGVYYVQAPADCGRIFFSDPRPQSQVLTPRYDPAKQRATPLWSEVYYQPIEGRLILFPAWLVHEVEPNMSQGEGPEADRVSVSFNFYQRSPQ